MFCEWKLSEEHGRRPKQGTLHHAINATTFPPKVEKPKNRDVYNFCKTQVAQI